MPNKNLFFITIVAISVWAWLGFSVVWFTVGLLAIMFVVAFGWDNTQSATTGSLDFYTEGINLVVREEDGIVSVNIENKEVLIPISDVRFSYKELTKTVTLPEVGSGMINGQLATWHTGKIVSGNLKTGEVLVTVCEKDKNVGAIVLKQKKAESLRGQADRIIALGRKLKAEMQTQVSKERELRLREEALHNEERDRQVAKVGQENIDRFVHQCGATDAFYLYEKSPETGALVWALVADRIGNGGVLYNSGSGLWTGGWRGSQVAIKGHRLEIVLDDELYRRHNLKEHRVSIVIHEDDRRLEWADRIAILSKMLIDIRGR